MQPPVNHPGNRPDSAYGGAGYGGAYAAPSGGAGAPYGGGMPGYPSAASMAVDPRTVPPHLAPAYGVSMIEAYRRYLRRAFTFRGYASRSEYWWAALVNVLILIAFYALIGVLVAIEESSGGQGDSAAGIVALVLTICFLLFWVVNTIPQLAVFVRRMHDGGRSGWWFLLFFLPLGELVLLIFACMEPRPHLWRPEWSR